MSLQKAVAAKLAAQRGHEEAAALWTKLWSAYEKGGADGAEQFLANLLDSPGDDDDDAEGA